QRHRGADPVPAMQVLEPPGAAPAGACLGTPGLLLLRAWRDDDWLGGQGGRQRRRQATDEVDRPACATDGPPAGGRGGLSTMIAPERELLSFVRRLGGTGEKKPAGLSRGFQSTIWRRWRRHLQDYTS